MPNTFTKATSSKITAVWGGALARMTSQDDIWLGIPIGHQTVNAHFGTTTSAPDTTYSPASTADDLLGVIWTPCSTIKVTKCKIIYGEGGTTNITHRLCLMRYDIDVDGDLTNGIEMGATASILNSDDYSHVRSTSLTINGDNTVTTDQVLIGMIMCNTSVNFAVTAKCIIEYTMNI